MEASTKSVYQRWAAGFIILAAAAWSTWGALHPFSGDTTNSRMATVYALVHDGTWQIDAAETGNPFANRTVDKVKVDGKLYSSKPPVMPLMMTVHYWVLHRIANFDLDREGDRLALLKIQVITFITIPFALAGFAFYFLLRSYALGTGATLIPIIALMSGTEYAGYAAAMNNHVPATACLIGAFAVFRCVDEKKNVQTGIICALAGLCLGLSVVIDLPSAIFVVVLAIAFVSKFSRQNIAWAVAAASIPLIVHCAIMISLHGSPVPFQMNHEYYMYEESYWRDPYGVDGLNHPWGLYLFNMTIGRVGVFLLYPVMVIGLMELLFREKGRDRRQSLWNASILAAFLILVLYYLTGTNNYGGASYGFRWFIIITPFFLVGAAQAVDRIANTPGRIVVWIALAISIASAIQCRNNLWSVNHEWPTQLFGPLV
ncbi:MAG: hypothetical protein VCD00_07025 [Candidatus Hydrogenedentota bacterium]